MLARRALPAILLLVPLAPSAGGTAKAPAEVSIPTADGGLVRADLYDGSGSAAVVLAHGKAFDKASWRSFADFLTASGYDVLALDFRGYGGSRPGKETAALHEDVLAAVRWLRERGAPAVAVVGSSMGGGAAARAAVECSAGEIDRLVLISPAPIAEPERLRLRKLYLASAEEPFLDEVERQFERAPEPKRLMLLDGSAHGQHLFGTDQSGRLMTAVLDFLGQR
jgi:pimeloyl-ACP methyl ester carboxylesterase